MYERLRYRLLPKTRDRWVLLIGLWVLLFVFVVLPIGLMFFYSFAESFPVIGPLSFTFEHYTDLFADTDLLIDITVNTFIYAGGATIVAMTIGVAMAIFVEKYFSSSKLQLVILLPYGLPGIAALTGWIILLGNNGVLTRLIVSALGLSEAPYTIYSIPGMIWVEGLHTAPVAFLLVLPAIQAIPGAMEEASFVVGASRLRTVRKVILPVIWPSILSTAIFLFARTMATVATPSILGIPERIYTFGSAIPFLFLSGANLSYSRALSFSVFLTLISAVLILYYMRVQAHEGRYTTVTGKGRSQSTRYDTGIGRRTTYYAFVVGYIVVAGVLPLVAITYDSLFPTLQLSFDLSKLTLDNYVALVSGGATGVSNLGRVITNTLVVGVIVPTSAMTIALLISYSNLSVKLPSARVMSFAAATTLAIPGIAKGLGFLVAFIRTPLYGTLGILIVAFHGQALPIAMRYASPALTRIGLENFEASTTVGDGVFGTFRRITLPLVSSDFVAGWMHLYVSIVRNIPIAILLYATGSEVLAVELLNVLNAGFFKTASTLAVLIAVISVIPYMLLQYLRLTRVQPDRA
ncbi:MAG: ABC transporter permease subunit [Halobacteriales archaeon]|nr:ABC transporter permease subunit [Halobacteriales archaeon]